MAPNAMSSHHVLILLGGLLALAGCGNSTTSTEDQDAGGPNNPAEDGGGTTSPVDGGGGGKADGGSGDGGDGGPVLPTDDCASGPVGLASDATGVTTKVKSNGFVELDTAASNAITSLKTTLLVPPPPPQQGTVFLWPGIQPLPGGNNYEPIDNGVLQPVLTWGPTCAPHFPSATPYASWWISAQYVNTFGSHAGYTGCSGGPGMNVQPGELLGLEMTLDGTTWKQKVTDAKTGKSVAFDIDMLGQAQARADFAIEDYAGGSPTTDVVFTDTQVTFAGSSFTACQPIVRGANDYFATPHTSADGRHCCISRIILRAVGVAATSPNEP